MKNKWCLAFALVIGLSACGSEIVTWQEEAKQADGSILLLERTIRIGGGHEIGQSAPVASESISFIHPKTGKKITWNSPTDLLMSVDPMLVQLDGDRTLVLVAPRSSVDLDHYGQPCPPFVLQEIRNGKIENKPAQELLEKFRFMNLVFYPKIKKTLQRIKEEKFLSVNVIRDINSGGTNKKLMAIDYSYKPNSYKCE
ncbi:hypothetical protein [Chitinibacter sp. S2-10]|uniref:hypothetical protein n=1 Tax=Chitinibacter sp. S2-10 TaxID=3373597 RepID=UPI0039778F5A